MRVGIHYYLIFYYFLSSINFFTLINGKVKGVILADLVTSATADLKNGNNIEASLYLHIVKKSSAFITSSAEKNQVFAYSK